MTMYAPLADNPPRTSLSAHSDDKVRSPSGRTRTQTKLIPPKPTE